MSTSAITLDAINRFLNKELSVERFPKSERGGIYRPSNQLVKRIGLALEPFSSLSDWVQEQQLDALWLHRPWQLDLTTLPPDIGVLSQHLPFDEALTIGYNPRLAQAMAATSALEPLGYKQDNTDPTLPQRPIGMLFDVEQQEFDDFLATTSAMFKGYDRAEAGNSSVSRQSTSSRIAVVGAMTNTLVREAAERGADLYLTGAYRKPGQPAVDETGIAVIAVGHRRCEEWGMQVLADILQDQWPIDCVVREPMLIL